MRKARQCLFGYVCTRTSASVVLACAETGNAASVCESSFISSLLLQTFFSRCLPQIKFCLLMSLCWRFPVSFKAGMGACMRDQNTRRQKHMDFYAKQMRAELDKFCATRGKIWNNFAFALAASRCDVYW